MATVVSQRTRAIRAGGYDYGSGSENVITTHEDRVISKHDDKKASDKPIENEEKGEQQADAAAVDEATKSRQELVKQQRKELQAQKDSNRPSRVTSLKFGRPEIVGEGGKTLVKGTAVDIKDTTRDNKVSKKDEQKPAKAEEAPAKPSESEAPEKPAAPADAEDAREVVAKPKAVDQEKVIDRTSKRGASTPVGWYAGSEPIIDALRGTTEAERESIKELYKKTYGKDLEVQLRETLSGTDLTHALNLLNLKEADAVKVPAGMKREDLVAANALLHKTAVDANLFSMQVNVNVMNRTPAEIKVMNALYKEEYGVDWDHHLKNTGMSLDQRISQVEKVRADSRLDSDLDKTEKAKVNREEMSVVAKKLEAARKAEPGLPKHKYDPGEVREDGERGWKVGEHPAEKLIENLSEAQLKVLQEVYEEEYGFKLKDMLAQVPYLEGVRLVKILDRDDGHFREIPAERRPALREAAKELYKAMAPKGTDEALVYEKLKNLTAVERRAVAKYFEELPLKGGTLKEWIEGDFKGDEEEKALNYLKYGSDDEASNIHLAITKGDAAAAVARIGTLTTKEQLAEAEREFQQQNHVSIRDHIKSDDNLTEAAKKVLLIRLDSVGRKMTDHEWAAVIELSLVANTVKYGDLVGPRVPDGPLGDLKLFQSLMAEAPQHVRDKFMKDGGADKIEAAFKGKDDETDAEEYAKYGKLSVERMVRKQDKVLDDEKATVKALDTMNERERALYLRGAQIQKDYERKLREEERAREKSGTLEQISDFATTLLEASPAVKLAGSNYSRAKAEFANTDMTAGDKESLALDISSGEDEISRYVKMSDADKEALQKFKAVNSAIGGHCDGKECRDWRDNAVYSGGVDGALSDIVAIPWDKSQGHKGPTWQDYRAAGGRDKFIKEHKIDLMSEHAQKKILELFDKKLKAGKEEDLAYAGGEPLEKALAWKNNYPPDRHDVLNAIQRMTLEDQRNYRLNPFFREQIDNALISALPRVEYDERGAHLLAARRMLDQVAKGGAPVADAIVKINIEAGDRQTIETQVIRHLEEFWNQPGIRERLTPGNPRYDADLDRQLKQALGNALESDEYHWAEKVLKNGRLTFEEKKQLNQEEGGDRKDVYKDLTALVSATDAAAVNERRKLATDAAYRERVLGYLPADQREIAEKIIKQSALVPPKLAKEFADAKPAEKAQILKQLNTDEAYRAKELGGLNEQDRRLAIRVLEFGPVLPEDKIRAYTTGAATSKDEMWSVLRDLDSKPAQKEEFKVAYASAYHKDATGDLADKLTGADERKMLRLLRKNPETARERVFEAMDAATTANDDSVGSQATRALHSGAGDLGEDAVRQAIALMAQAAADGKVISPDDPRIKKLVDLAYDYTELFIQAKSETADFLANVALTAASFVVPGGMSLRLLLMATGGGLLKVGIKEVIAGDATMGDFASGFMNVGLNAFIPAHLARAANLGKKVAFEAGESVARKGAKYLVEGAEEKLTKELQGAAANAFAHGGGTIENKVLDRIVNSVVKKGANEAETNLARAQVRQMVLEEFETIAKREFSKGFKNIMGRQVLDTVGASVGGGVGGMVDAVIEIDTSKSFEENMSKILEAGFAGAKMGAKMGFGLGAGFKLAGAGFRVVTRKMGKGAADQGSWTEVAGEGEFKIVRPEKAPEPKGKPIVVAPDQVAKIGKGEYYADGNGVLYKNLGDAGDGKIKLARDDHAEIAVSDKGSAKLEQAATAKTAHDQGTTPTPARATGDAQPARTAGQDTGRVDAEAPVPAGRSGTFESVTAVDMSGVAVAPSGVGGHTHGSTAPRQHLTVNGKPVSAGQELVLGRTGDVRVEDAKVSKQHAAIRVDANGNTYVRDLGSTNGTFINGRRYGPEHGEYILKPGDRVHLGGTHEISWGRQLEPTYHISAGKQDVTLQVGKEVPIGAGAFGDNSFIKSSQAKVGMDEKGLYIVEGATPSGKGTWVNQQHLKPGEKVYLKPTDDVRIGEPYTKIGAERQGDWLFIMPREVSAVPEVFRPADPVEFKKAVQDSNDYARSHEISTPIKDGWQNAGQRQTFDEMGNFSRKDRPAVVVDRQNDPVLRNVIADAKKQFAHLPAKERAAALTDYVNKLMSPEGMSGRSLDAWYDNFSNQHAGKRLYLGEFIKQGKGVCSQQATLLKVLGDELGLEVKLVRGAGDSSQLNTINHVWTEIKIPGQKDPLVYDPRGRIKGSRYEDLPAHRTGYDIDHGKPQRLHSPDMAYTPADVIINGQPWTIDARGVQVGRGHGGTIDTSQPNAMSASSNHALLRRGDDGVLYIRDGSSQGTYINGQKIPRGKDWPINPTDDVRLGSPDGPALSLRERQKPPADVAISGSPLKINSGEEIPIGRQHGLDPNDPKNKHVSREHAFLYRDPDGRLYIRDESSSGTWVNGKRIPMGQAWPIGPNDSVRLGTADGPELNLTPRRVTGPARDVLPPGAVKADSAVTPKKAVFGHQEWDVAGFDPGTGDVVLRQKGRGAGFEVNARPVTDADLVHFPELPIDGKSYRRDAQGNIYELVNFGGRKQLIQSNEYVAKPTKDVSFRAPETPAAPLQ